MDPPPPAVEANDGKNARQANPQPNQPTQQASTSGTAPTHSREHGAPASLPAPDVSALAQGDLQNLQLQGLPADMNLLPMMPQDGSLLTDDALMNMPLMMPMMIDGSGMPSMPQNGITNDEIALYDRQIRLWGMQAQQKIRNANVLLITMKGLGNEIAKNLVLAGIGSLTIVDHENVSEADLGAQFLVSQDEGHLGVNRAQAALPEIQKLNPRVNIIVDTGDVRLKTASYFALYDMIIATDLDPDALNIINTATRLNLRPFYAAGTHGLYGFIFADLIEHQFVIEREKPNVPTQAREETRTRMIFNVENKKEGGKEIELVSKRELYSTWLLASDGALLPEEYTKSKRRLRAVSPVLSCLRALWEFQGAHNGRNPADKNDLANFTRMATQKHKELSLPAETMTAEFLRNFLQNIGCEIAPVTAILGGQLAQDVINVLGQTQQPIQNMVIFDGNNMEASLYPLHPQGPLGADQLISAMSGIPDMGNSAMNGFGVGDPSIMNMAMPPMDMSMAGMDMTGDGGNTGGMASTEGMGAVGGTASAANGGNTSNTHKNG